MSQPPLRLAELVATLSIAADLGTGHPMERALRACLLALKIGEALGCDEATLADCYYVALLRYAGCAADARHRAALFGDEIALGVNHRPILHTCRRQYCTIVGNRAQPPRSSAIVHTCRDRRQSCTACRPPV